MGTVDHFIVTGRHGFVTTVHFFSPSLNLLFSSSAHSNFQEFEERLAGLVHRACDS